MKNRCENRVNVVLNLSLSQACLLLVPSHQYPHLVLYPLECPPGCPCPLPRALLLLRGPLEYLHMDLHRSLQQACTHQVRTEHLQLCSEHQHAQCSSSAIPGSRVLGSECSTSPNSSSRILDVYGRGVLGSERLVL